MVTLFIFCIIVKSSLREFKLETLFFTRKTDVMNLLESAGFSRSNPYYIVKQGKVSISKYSVEVVLDHNHSK